jgi:hypothetical protein
MMEEGGPRPDLALASRPDPHSMEGRTALMPLSWWQVEKWEVLPILRHEI